MWSGSAEDRFRRSSSVKQAEPGLAFAAKPVTSRRAGRNCLRWYRIPADRVGGRKTRLSPVEWADLRGDLEPYEIRHWDVVWPDIDV